jgi:hypothetical protein
MVVAGPAAAQRLTDAGSGGAAAGPGRRPTPSQPRLKAQGGAAPALRRSRPAAPGAMYFGCGFG